jgi:uncharacterized heparinase superfamily protein
LRAGEAEADRIGSALAVHALFLGDNLEWDLRGNHLLRDAVGLVFAHELLGCAPDALALLRDQVRAQLLADGCHVERVPLYHAVALQDLLEVRALLGASAPDWLRDAVARMAGFLESLLSGDGHLPLFGDTWHGEVDPARLLDAAGSRLPPEGSTTPEGSSGLVVLRRKEVQAVIRAGPHGPDHQLGHAHADGLSFELTRGRQRIITDTGTGTYDPGGVRDRTRCTAAHNTVQVDGEEQLEAWGSFRVGRRGRGRVLARNSDVTWDWLWATHDGYRWIRGGPTHHRLLAVSAETVLVLDAVAGSGDHRIRSALHLHPDVDLRAVSVIGLGGETASTEVPLYERFNEARWMREFYVEAETRLPWAGAWVVTFGDPGEVRTSELRCEGGRVVVEYADRARRIVASWRPLEPPVSASVHLTLGLLNP